jgi:hypothetical protein
MIVATAEKSRVSPPASANGNAEAGDSPRYFAEPSVLADLLKTVMIESRSA